MPFVKYLNLLYLESSCNCVLRILFFIFLVISLHSHETIFQGGCHCRLGLCRVIDAVQTIRKQCPPESGLTANFISGSFESHAMTQKDGQINYSLFLG